MNHIYKSIWNMALGCWVAAPETARSSSGGSLYQSEASSDFGLPEISNLKLALIGGLGAVLSLCSPASHANASPPSWVLNTSDEVVFTSNSVEWRNGLGIQDQALELNSSATVQLQTGPVSFNTITDGVVGAGISGSGGLTKVGAGTLFLTGANTYTGATHIAAGEIRLSGAGALSDTTALHMASGSYLSLYGANGGRSVGSLAGDGTVWLERNSLTVGRNDLDTTFAGTISAGEGGSAGLYKVGTGTLTLTGNNTHTGGTTITSGTLVAANSAALGTGAVSVGGASSDARLQVNSGSMLSNAVTLQSQGTLAGLGGVGATTLGAGATLAPGHSGALYGSLAIHGDLAFNARSVYQVNADLGSQSSSYVNVDGVATLAGAAVEVRAQGTYTVEREYTILSARQLQGSFGQVSANYAYLDPTLSQADSKVLLRLTRKQVPVEVDRPIAPADPAVRPITPADPAVRAIAFADLVTSPNQTGVAQVIEGLGRGNPLFNHIETLPSGAPPAAFAQLSGDAHATAAGSLPATADLAPSISSRHLHSNLSAGMRAGAPVAQSDGPLPVSAWPTSKALPAWVELVGHWQTYKGDGNAATLKQNTSGIFIGMDEEVGRSGWRVGGSLGYTHADGRVADRASSQKVNSYSGSVYGGKSFGSGSAPRINVLGGLAYTWSDIATTRNLTSLAQTLQADYSAQTTQLFAEMGYAIGQYEKQGFEPFVGVSLGQQRVGSFQERGGFAALNGRSSTDDLANTTLGVRAHSDFQVAGKDARVNATVGWRHALGDVATSKTMAFNGSQNFTVAGAPLARNMALVKLQADVALSRYSALVLGYQGEMGSGQRYHALNVKLRWAF